MSHDNIISDPESAKRYMEYKFLGETAECLYFAGLGNNGKVLFCDMVAQGTPDTVSISPSTVARAAVHANAVKAVLAHNHPYGICNPSNQDLQTTRILTEELARVGVELIDHIIVAADGVCSMRETRMMGPLR